MNKILRFFRGNERLRVMHITSQELQTIVNNNKDILLLDVRTPAEFKIGHISKAKNINVMSLKFKESIKTLDASKTIYVYCKSGVRSVRACKILLKQGFKNVHNLKKGILGWEGEIV